MTAQWRKSTFSADLGDCVEAALYPDGRIAVRNSKSPDEGTVFFTRNEMSAWLKGVQGRGVRRPRLTSSAQPRLVLHGRQAIPGEVDQMRGHLVLLWLAHLQPPLPVSATMPTSACA